jgi:hypothetical protein
VVARLGPKEVDGRTPPGVHTEEPSAAEYTSTEVAVIREDGVNTENSAAEYSAAEGTLLHGALCCIGRSTPEKSKSLGSGGGVVARLRSTLQLNTLQQSTMGQSALQQSTL